MTLTPPLAWLPPEATPSDVAFAAPAAPSGGAFVYLDLGAWTGDGKHAPIQRDFALCAGGLVALCTFGGEDDGAEVELEGNSAEVEALACALRTIAGPRGNEARVRRAVRFADGVPCDLVRVLLPEANLPLVADLPPLDREIIPDPTAATCACHGPFLSRVLYGAKIETVYRAIGCKLGRDPNGWHYLLSEIHDPAAEALTKLLSRLPRHRGAVPLELVQLGRCFELWQGFDCLFAGSGRAAFLDPRIRRDIDATAFREWDARVREGPAKDAARRFFSLRVRTLHLGDATPTARTGAILFERGHGTGRAPHAILSLKEQHAIFNAWRPRRPAFGRTKLVEEVGARWIEAAGAFSLYVTTGAQIPCVVKVHVESC